jgi:non-ribosomal peptide synthetase component F
VPLVHEWLERQVVQRQDAIALTLGEFRLGYRELNERANRLARALRARGVVADMPVGLCLPDGPDAIIGMLAILKAGGGYVPLDPHLPVARLAQILECAQPGIVVTHSSLAGLLGAAHDIFRIDSERVFVDEQVSRNLMIPVEPDHLCYVMFTSGSTGVPKGVMVTHGNLEHLFDEFVEQLAISPDDVWTQAHRFSFGFSVWEIWGALRHGGRLVFVPRDARIDPGKLIDIVRTEGVTILSQTPSAFRQNFLANERIRSFDLPLRSIVLSGEAVAQW